MYKTLIAIALALACGCTTPVMTVTSTPPGAFISVNGQSYGETPTKIPMRSRSIPVLAELPGYDSQPKKIESTGKHLNVHFVLEPASSGLAMSRGGSRGNGSSGGGPQQQEQQQQSQQMQGPTVVLAGGGGQAAPAAAPVVPAKEYGLIAVLGTENAKVYINGTLVGNVPLRGLRLETGNHSLEVTMTGFKSFREAILVTSGASVQFLADLEPNA